MPQGIHPARPERPRTIFCLPYAGGGASAYTGLQRELAADVTVTPLHLPGRESRITEPPVFTIGRITDEIALATGEPYALYGHSMGARIVFEVARELRRRGLPAPTRLYVGGAHPPHRRVPLAVTADLPDDAFIDQLVRRAGAHPELKHEPELRELLLPLLRADFTWIKNYRYAPEPPLDVPIMAFTGLDDGEVSAADMLGWARHTTAGFGLRTLHGGHFFVKDTPADLARLIAADLAGRAAAPEPDEVRLLLRQPPAPAPPARTPDPSRAAAPPAGTLRRHPGQDAAPPTGTLRRHPDETVRLPPDPDGWASVCHAGELWLAATARDPRVGVAIALAAPSEPPRAAELSPAELSPAEREQIEDAAEEDRHWLELRTVMSKRALAAAGARDVARAAFPDLADPGPWRARDDRPGPHSPSRWQVLHLPLPTTRGEALAAVAVPYDRVRLSLDVHTGDLPAGAHPGDAHTSGMPADPTEGPR
ncbi:thioesterase II family protein [Nonomuraea indica]|uniref:Thioesterase II family protein n=1 Tax=Nonomuraea indica TaxID=1581193 RepID=A0ABW8A7Z0_9ACTN